jgi:hypothetical protein
MAKTYQSIIDKAEIILQDEDSDQTTRRWTETELLGWAKDGEEQIATLKSDAYPVVTVVALAAGSQQSLGGTRAVNLIDVLCNMGTDGSTRGDVVEVVEKGLMNAVNPGWMSDTANTTVTHVIYDSKRTPKLFWVYPKSPGTNYLELVLGELPDNDSKVIGDNIMVADEYGFVLMHFIIAMAFAKDTDIPNSGARVQQHMNLFLEGLGRKEATEEIYNPMKTRDTN